jgi:hypothetical protein
MRFFSVFIIAALAFFLSCMQHNNPFDINDPNYQPPEIFIDSSAVHSGDYTALESITLKISGNKPQVSIRWSLDSLQWSSWQQQGRISVDGYGLGRHIIIIQGRYGEGGEIDDTVLVFFKVNAPALNIDAGSLLNDSVVAVNSGHLCTLQVNASGSGILSFRWYRNGITIDSTSGARLIIGPFSAQDSGTYYVVARNNWGADTSEAVFLRYISPVNDPPIAIDQAVSTNEDSPLNITLTATDPDGITITGWEISRQPGHGTLTGSGAARTYMSAQDYFGADTFLFRANDGVNWSDTGMIAIAILPVNDPPVWKQSIVELTVKEGKTVSLDLGTAFSKDPDSDSVAFSKKSGVGTIAGTTWSWTPGFTAAASGPASCIITATDNGTPQKSSDISLTITVDDSLCRLTTSVAFGNGTIQTPGTTFDPGSTIQITAVPGTDYVFKNWSGDVPNASLGTATVSIVMNSDKAVSATFVKIIETVTLNIGESSIHGSTFVNDYFYLTTATMPAKILKINANNLADYKAATFPTWYNWAEQVVYSTFTKKLYTVFANMSEIKIAEIDPGSLSYVENKIRDTTHSNGSGSYTIATDGPFLYATSYSANGRIKICKYSLTTFSGAPVDTIDLGTSLPNAHSMQYDGNYLYITGASIPPWVAKVRTEDMALIQAENRNIPGIKATDDFAVTDKYLFIGTESPTDSIGNGVIYRVAARF